MKLASSRNGFVMLFALWVLAFLSVLSVAVGLGARQKIVLLERLEARSRQHLAAEAGAKRAIAILLDDLEDNQFILTAAAKARRHQNPSEFSRIALGDSFFSVGYKSYDEKQAGLVECFGLADEQAKLNINLVDGDTLARLLGDVLNLTTEDARRLAVALLDWRDFGKREVEGFFSDDYYKNLEHPYSMKEHPFERIDELLLVKGMNREKYDKIVPYLTVWGDGKININTVSEKVLVALGLEQPVVAKILQARRGQDALKDTSDDHVFQRTFDIAAEVKAIVPLEEREARQIDDLNKRNLLTCNSFIYSTRSWVHLADGQSAGSEVLLVFDGLSNKILFWYEK